MPLPPTLLRRPMHGDDGGRWADLLAAVEEADRLGEHYDADDCAEELAEPDLDLERDSLIVLDGERAVAYQLLRVRSGPELGPRVLCDAAVHPAYRRRGIGTVLLAVARERAGEQGAAVHIQVPESNAGAVALAERSGLTPVRWWSELVRDLTEPVAAAPPPDGVSIVPLGPGFDAGRWNEPLRLAHNAAFAGHWGSVPVSAQAWAHHRTGGRAFRPACSAVALTGGGEVAGYVISYEYAADTERTGRRDLYVGIVGTLAPYRGRGIAVALLTHVLGVAARLGFTTSSLMVDTQNPTGALGAYGRAGYRLHRREATYALEAASVAARAVP